MPLENQASMRLPVAAANNNDSAREAPPAPLAFPFPRDADAHNLAQRDAWRTAVLSIDDLAHKRRLLDDMESWRSQPAVGAANGNSAIVPVPAAVANLAVHAPRPADAAAASEAAARDDDEVPALRLRLHAAESTCALLEEEMSNLERQTLAAMAEAGRLRKALDEIERNGGKENMGAWWRERVELTRRLADAERSRELLTSALMDSEAEIARLTRTLESAAHRLELAG